jgi:transcriptional regulator with XRE-family HTH domain
MATKIRKPTGARKWGIKKVRDNSSLQDYDHYFRNLAIQQGFKSYTDYRDSWSKKLGYKSHKEYVKSWRRKHGFSSEKKFQTFLAAKKGLETAWEYQKALMSERRHRLRNRKLSLLMIKRMQELDLSCVRLGKLTGISAKQISEYRRGMFMPKETKLKKILKALGRGGITDKYDNFLEPG